MGLDKDFLHILKGKAIIKKNIFFRFFGPGVCHWRLSLGVPGVCPGFARGLPGVVWTCVLGACWARVRRVLGAWCPYPHGSMENDP